MRHPRSLNRALAHPAGAALGRRVTPVPPPGSGGPSARPGPLPCPENTRPYPGAEVGAVLLTSAGLLTLGVVGSAAPPSALPVAGGLIAAGFLVQRPRTAWRTVAALVTVLLLPALLVIAVAVRLSGPGPVLVRPPLEGAGDRRPREPLRFRTTARAVGGPSTRVGRMLRSYSLDKLPALIDVVRGEQSLLSTGAR